MNSGYIEKALPRGYRFKETQWFQSALKENDEFRYKILLISHIIALAIVTTIAVLRLISGLTIYAPNFITAYVLITASLASLIRLKNLVLMIPVTLLLMLAGFITTSFVYTFNYVYILILFSFPILAFTLTGIEKGLRWTAGITSFAAVAIVLAKYGILHNAISKTPPSLITVECFTYLILTILSYTVERQHRKYICKMAIEIVYDRTTALPDKDSILQCMDHDTNYLVSIINIANFNQIVSIFGYELSDSILQFVVKNIREIQSLYGFEVYRLRGHEIGILLPLWDNPPRTEDIERYLYGIWGKLSERSISWNNTDIRLVYRISGVISIPSHRASVLSNADHALKEGIRLHQAVTIYNSKNDQEQESALVSMLRFTTLSENIQNGSFKALFQPIVETEQRSVVWYETLLRIKNSADAYESPIEYLQMAKSTGLDTTIACFMFGEACKALERSNADISINITLQDMLNRKFLDRILSEYPRINRGESRLILEILERDELNDSSDCLSFINRVREAGCMIAIDDFGTGHSNFANLLALPVDIVKIDGFLVKTILHSANARSMLESVTAVLNKMNIPIVAEYVESVELFEILKSLNVQYAQGHLFGKPDDTYF